MPPNTAPQEIPLYVHQWRVDRQTIRPYIGVMAMETPMRDIREDIRDRLKQLNQEREQHKFALEGLDERERSLKALLADEVQRWGSHEPSLFQAVEGQNSQAAKQERELTLSTFLLGTLADGHPWSLDELKAKIAATDLLTDSPSPGRSLNFALVGLQRHGYVDRLATGRATGSWILARPDTSQSEAASDETGASANTEAPGTDGSGPSSISRTPLLQGGKAGA